MPELPDIVVYLEALERRIPDRTLLRCRVTSPFVLRSAGVQPAELDGHAVVGLRRLGKRIVIVFEGELAAVIHLMIAGRLHWKPPGAQIPRRGGLAAFDFAEGSLLLTEAGTKHRASLHLVRGAAEIGRLYRGTQETLQTWTARLRAETGTGFPEKVTAFRPAMAVHGRYRLPCPVCAAPVQRIRYAENEVNYCPRCQTGGKVLTDRALSRLLKTDWPRSLDEWEERFRPGEPRP